MHREKKNREQEAKYFIEAICLGVDLAYMNNMKLLLPLGFLEFFPPDRMQRNFSHKNSILTAQHKSEEKEKTIRQRNQFKMQFSVLRFNVKMYISENFPIHVLINSILKSHFR